MAKEVNEDTGFKVSVKTLIGIGFAMATVISMWFMLQADIEEAKQLIQKYRDQSREGGDNNKLQIKEAEDNIIIAQNKIDDLDIESKKIYFEYKDTLNEYKSLKNYDDQLAKIISAQIQEIESIKNQLDSLDNINIDILPLLKRMVDSLSKFISIDIPFLENERIARINELDSLIVRSDITAVAVPLLTSLIYSFFSVSNNLIRVPFWEQVAKILPS